MRLVVCVNVRTRVKGVVSLPGAEVLKLVFERD